MLRSLNVTVVMNELFALDLVMGHNDMRGKFPLWQLHSIVVLNDRMCVAGNNLRPGDYV